MDHDRDRDPFDDDPVWPEDDGPSRGGWSMQRWIAVIIVGAMALPVVLLALDALF